MEFYFAGGTGKFLLALEVRFNIPPDVSVLIRAYSGTMADIRLLIVDDTERVRQDLCTFLTLTGDIVIVGQASNGLEAIRLAESLRPQVILMDLEMPIMDGYQATRQIKMTHPSCRVIALTIHGGETEKHSALQAGADDFIVKGVPLELLLKAIHGSHDTPGES